MSFDTFHIPPRTRQLIVDRYYAESDIPKIKPILSQTHNVSITSINKYIKRHSQTGTVLTEAELSKQYGNNESSERRKIFDDDEFKSFVLESCKSDPTQPLTKYVEDFHGDIGSYIGRSTINRLFINQKKT